SSTIGPSTKRLSVRLSATSSSTRSGTISDCPTTTWRRSRRRQVNRGKPYFRQYSPLPLLSHRDVQRQLGKFMQRGLAVAGTDVLAGDERVRHGADGERAPAAACRQRVERRRLHLDRKYAMVRERGINVLAVRVV